MFVSYFDESEVPTIKRPLVPCFCVMGSPKFVLLSVCSHLVCQHIRVDINNNSLGQINTNIPSTAFFIGIRFPLSFKDCFQIYTRSLFTFIYKLENKPARFACLTCPRPHSPSRSQTLRHFLLLLFPKALRSR